MSFVENLIIFLVVKEFLILVLANSAANFTGGPLCRAAELSHFYTSNFRFTTHAARSSDSLK